MEFIVVLLCLVIQKFWPEGARFHPNSWFNPYYRFIKDQAEKFSMWRSYWAILCVVIPVLLAFLLLSVAMRGLIGHFLLSLFIVWYSLGLDRLKAESGDQVDDILINSYRNIFAVIFWYTLVGPLGAVLYYLLRQLNGVLEQEPQDSGLLMSLNRVIGVMDWVPVRILGISYALVGHFATLFPLWLKDLPGKLEDNESHVVEWGVKSLELSKSEESSKTDAAYALVQRSVAVWLVALALISVGYWIG
jgi:AmpE protein